MQLHMTAQVNTELFGPLQRQHSNSIQLKIYLTQHQILPFLYTISTVVLLRKKKTVKGNSYEQVIHTIKKQYRSTGETVF